MRATQAKPTLLAARFPARLRARAARVAVLAFDSDGTLTDRGMFVDSEGREIRRFDVRDGLSLTWAERAGIHVVVISGRTSRALDHRGDDLGIAVVQGAKDKVAVLERFCGEREVTRDQVAFLGDDLPDLAALRWCGLPLAVADAHPLVKAAAEWVTSAPGGQGAAREVVEAVLEATGRWASVLERYGETT